MEKDYSIDIKENDISFLEIAGISHNENAWSDIYAYFLREEGFRRLFLESLLELIGLKSNQKISIEDFIVEREVITNSQNRIDLLIKSKSHSIIIENKIHHILNNDLEDYWISINGGVNNKTGIVLTLSRILTNHPHYLNITHKEWITEVRKRLNDDAKTLNPKAILIFKDFYQTVMKESKVPHSQSLRSYLEDRARINEFVDIATQTKKWLMQIFKDHKFISSLRDFSLVHDERVNSNYRYVMYKLSGTDELVITILYEFLWNSKPGNARLLFLIEPIGSWFKKANKLEEEITQIVKEEGIGYNYHHCRSFWHCGGVERRFSEEQILDEDFIKNCIVEQLVSPTSKLMKATKRIAELISSAPRLSYSWEDVIVELRKSIVKNEDIDAQFLISQIDFKCYEPTSKILILEVTDNIIRWKIERYLDQDILRAVRYVYGQDAKYSILCRQLMY